MSVPRQVEEAAELAEQLMNQMNEEPAPQEEGTVKDDTPQEDAPHDDVEELKKYKDRYLSLKGKYDAEVPRLHSELKEFKQSVFEKFNNLEVKPQEQPEPQVDETIQKFREEYGDDLYDAIRHILKSEVNPLLTQAVKPVQDQVASVLDAQTTADQAEFAKYLDLQVKGDWRSLWKGDDPDFTEFMDQPDPSGLYTYGELANAYNDKWNGEKLAKIFNLYLEPLKPKQNNPSPAQDAMIAPSRSTVHSTPSAENKTIWTQESIREFEKADRAGKYTSEESAAQWQDLLSAVAENRIRN